MASLYSPGTDLSPRVFPFSTVLHYFEKYLIHCHPEIFLCVYKSLLFVLLFLCVKVYYFKKSMFLFTFSFVVFMSYLSVTAKSKVLEIQFHASILEFYDLGLIFMW